MNQSSAPTCPQCGAPLPAYAPAGMCPKCLMAMNLQAPTLFTGELTAESAPLPPAEIAPHFPQLEILACLGRGGMGVVYKARQKSLDRLVALKLLAPERAADRQFAERFTREARALAALNHPNIVTIYDFGQAGGFYFLLMEFVDGLNLRQVLRARKMTPEEALAVVPPLCQALQFAHDRGIVHCDIKPENLLLDQTGRIKVADFGVAKILGVTDPAAPTSAAAATHAGGTPGYSAPEQAADPAKVNSRADIYSLGAVFYEMLTGELPGARLEPPSRKVQIDVRLDAVVLRALAATPELRWQTATEFGTQVETIAASPAPSPTQAAAAPPAAELRKKQAKIVLWGLALAVCGTSLNFELGLWATLTWILGSALALAAGGNLRQVQAGLRLVLVEGIVIAAAGAWSGGIASNFPGPWRAAIIAGCIAGIAYCLACWARMAPPGSAPRAPRRTAPRRFQIAGALVLFTGGTVGIALHHFLPRSLENYSWALDSRDLRGAPPVDALRPSRDATSGTVGTDDRMVARGVPLGVLMAYAYGTPAFYVHWSEARVVLPPGVADQHYDVLVAAPDHPQAALQQLIRRQLGLAAHREVRETAALVLLVSDPGVAAVAAAAGGSSSDQRGVGHLTVTNEPIDLWSDFLEDALGQPVINETEFTGKFSGQLAWTPQADKTAELRAIQATLSAQLGLTLVPRRELVEMLVVDKLP